MDESLEREGYEHSNSLSKCPIHLCEYYVTLDGKDYCELCDWENSMRMQEIDDITLPDP